jgi:O-antigen/teichoic acid export membrane protein
VKDLYANGSYFFVVSYLDTLPQQFPSLILGRSGDTFEVGNFDRGRNIQNLFQNWFNIPIRQIGIPLVRARYHSEGFLKDSIQKVHRLTLHILLPIYVIIFCQAELFVEILYGNNYTAVVPILRILMIAAMIQTCDYIRLWVTVILNQGKNSLKHAIVSFLIYASCIFPMASSGVLQITGGYLLGSFLTMLAGFWFLRKLEEVDVLNLLLISLQFLLIYAPLCLVLWFLHQRFMSELPNLIVFCFELSLIIATSLIHLKYSEFLSEFIHILKKLIFRK